MTDKINQDNLKKVLVHLENISLEHPSDITFASELSKNTSLDINEIKKIGNHLIISEYVDVDHYSDDGSWAIKINHSGKDKLNELNNNQSQEKNNVEKTAQSSNISVTGNYNRVTVEQKTAFYNNWSKRKKLTIVSAIATISAVITILSILGVPTNIYSYIHPQDEPKSEIPSSVSIPKSPQLSAKLFLEKFNDNTTLAELALYNNGSATASNILIIINPTQKILNWDKRFSPEEVYFTPGGDLSLKANIPRIGSCIGVLLDVFTEGTPEDTDYAVYVTSDNANSLVYHTTINGKQFADSSTDVFTKTPCD